MDAAAVLLQTVSVTCARQLPFQIDGRLRRGLSALRKSCCRAMAPASLSRQHYRCNGPLAGWPADRTSGRGRAMSSAGKTRMEPDTSVQGSAFIHYSQTSCTGIERTIHRVRCMTDRLYAEEILSGRHIHDEMAKDLVGNEFESDPHIRPGDSNRWLGEAEAVIES